MTDRFRRHKTRKRWIIRITLLVIAYLVMRTVGPGVALVRTDSLVPLVRPGDVVLTRRGADELDPGDVVTVSVPPGNSRGLRYLFESIRERLETRGDQPSDETAMRQPRRVPRVVIGLPGEQVTWDDTQVTVRGAAGVRRYTFEPIHPDISAPTRQLRLSPDEVFLVALTPGRIDSRVIGPIGSGEISSVFRRIVWPRERRAVVSGSVHPEQDGIR